MKNVFGALLVSVCLFGITGCVTPYEVGGVVNPPTGKKVSTTIALPPTISNIEVSKAAQATAEFLGYGQQPTEADGTLVFKSWAQTSMFRFVQDIRRVQILFDPQKHIVYLTAEQVGNYEANDPNGGEKVYYLFGNEFMKRLGLHRELAKVAP